MSRMGPREPGPVGLLPRLSIDHLLWVANTRHGPAGHWSARVARDTGDHDHLADPSDAADYLARHRVPIPEGPPGPAPLADLLAIREAVRGLVDVAAPAWPPAVASLLERTRFVAREDGAIHADADGWEGLVGDLMLPLVQLARRREYVRACGNPLCRLVFLDESKNHSRRWCDTGGCGNRDRVRRYRGGAAGRRQAGVAVQPASCGSNGRTTIR